MAKMTSQELEALPRIRVSVGSKQKIERQAKKQNLPEYILSIKAMKLGLQQLGY